MRVGIASGSRTGIEALRRAVAETPHDVAWTALSGLEAVERCRTEGPDVLLLAFDLPDLDGIEVVRRVMETTPCAILVVARPGENVGRVYDAMGLGAMDVVTPPVLDLDGALSGAGSLAARLTTVAKLIARREPAPAPPPAGAVGEAAGQDVPLVAAGASTGGPQALATVLAALPADLAATIVIVQHIDAAFAKGLASWLADRCGFAVELAEPGTRPRRSTAHIAATADHLVLDADGRFAHVAEPTECIHRPSVDVFFQSLVPHRTPGLAILLTGMGRDGAAGLLELRRAGWSTVCQDERTAVVSAMPEAAAALGAADQVLSLPAIAATITAFATHAERRS